MQQTSKEFAVALFELAREADRETEYKEDLALLDSYFAENPDYVLLLSAPGIDAEERCSLLRQAFEGQVDERVLAFAELLCKKGYLPHFADCRREYDDLYGALAHTAPASITSATELTEDEKNRLIGILEKKTGLRLLPEYRIDPTLLGGFTANVNGILYDGSLSRKLHDLTEGLKK